MELPSVSIFTGAGGLDIGLENAGFSFKLCIESDPKRCELLAINRPNWNAVCSDIREMSTRTILRRAGLRLGEVALISGGPPCQSFSKAAFWVPGRFRPYRRDKRALLLREFARVVVESRPEVFILENVAGLAYSTNRRYLDLFNRMIRKVGYTVSWRVIDASHYGIPQRRERLFIIGSRDGTKFEFPKATHGDRSNTDLKPLVTAGEAFADLDDRIVLDSEKVHGKWGHLLSEIPPGQNYLYFTRERGHPKPMFKYRSRFWLFLAKLSPNKPSLTIPAHPGTYTGPFHWRNRRLRISEVKRLQTIPDRWHVGNDYSEAWASIGDAVPPMLARLIGRSIVRQFF